jgi:hypothetical protein
MTQPPTVPPSHEFPPPVPGERPPTPSSPAGSKTFLWLGIGGAVVILGVVGAFALSGSGSAPGTVAPTPTPSVAASPTEVIPASTSPLPTATSETSEPSAAATPTEDDVVIEEVSSNEDMLDQLFQAVLGRSNRKVDRITSVKLDEANEAGNLAVTWTINDNSAAAKVKIGAWADIKKILQVVQDSGVPVKKIVLVGTFSDGGAKEGQVIRAAYSWSKVKKLDVGAASPVSVVAIADSFQAQPGFR